MINLWLPKVFLDILLSNDLSVGAGLSVTKQKFLPTLTAGVYKVLFTGRITQTGVDCYTYWDCKKQIISILYTQTLLYLSIMWG